MMNFIDGIHIHDKAFAELPINAQDRICAKVSSQIRYLPEFLSEGYYGRPYGQEWMTPPPGLSTNTSGSAAVVRPYKTYEEFCSAMYRASQVYTAISTNNLEWRPSELESMAKFTSVFPGWEPNEPKLTWIDPKMANMIARQIKGDDGSEDWEVFPDRLGMHGVGTLLGCKGFKFMNAVISTLLLRSNH